MTRLQPDQHKKFTQKINLKYRLRFQGQLSILSRRSPTQFCTMHWLSDRSDTMYEEYRLASTRQCTGNVSNYPDPEPGSRDTGAGAGIIVRKSLSYCWKSGTWDRGLNIGCTQVRHYTLHYLVSSWACSAACCSGDVLAAEVEEQTGLFLRWDERGAEEHVMLQSALAPTRVLTWCCLLGAEYGPRMCSAVIQVIHSLSEILPVYEVLTIMQDIGYWKHELLGCKIYGR